MKLSEQAIGSIMMALQRSLLDQSDIVPIFKGWELESKGKEVFVINPPVVDMRKVPETEDTEEQMPRYCYRCNECEYEYDIWHSMTERETTCPQCRNEGSLFKIPQFTTKTEQEIEYAVGDRVKEFIEETRKDVKTMKEEIKREVYEP